jgi:transcriptional regulator with XRE-family HTH domain
MSSTIYKSFAAPNVNHSKQPVVSAQLETLSEYVRAVMNEKGLNYRQVAERSGDLISHTTVFDVVNLRSKDVKAKTLRGLAKGLGVSEEEVFAVVRGKTTSGDLAFDELRLLELYRMLPPERRLETIAHLEVAYQFYAGAHEPRIHPVASTSTGSSKRSEKKRA